MAAVNESSIIKASKAHRPADSEEADAALWKEETLTDVSDIIFNDDDPFLFPPISPQMCFT